MPKKSTSSSEKKPSKQDQPPSYDKLLKLLDKHKAKYRLIDHAPEGRTELVSKMRGNDPAHAANCIIFMVKIGKKVTKYVLAVLPGNKKVDFNAVKALFGGSYISFASKDIAEKLAGSPIGSFLPFPFSEELELIVDPTIKDIDTLFFNAARLDQSVALATKDYLKIAEPRFEPIAEGSVAVPKAKESSKKKSKADQLEWTELDKKRHSAAHVLAEAVLEMFPEAKLGVGPPIEHGFYYDFDLPRTLIPEDLAILETHMHRIMKEKQKFEVYTEPKDKALAYLKKIKQKYKIELVEGIDDDTVGFAKNGPFVDLCKNPHVDDTSKIGYFKLMSIAGAYWKGDSTQPMLQRIYAALFETKEELEAYLKQQEEAKKRDHRILGKQLEIFTISELVGSGLPLWMPKGTMIRETLIEYLKREQVKLGYLSVTTPHIGKIDLYKTSGHWQTYRDSMYAPIQIDDEEYILKPMNCPHHVQIYKADMRSYRDLPIRLAEFGTVYRYEKSGVLHGLTRVRGFTVDDAHLFVRPDQVKEEFARVLKLILKILGELGLTDYSARIGLRDKDKAKYVGSDALWAQAEQEVEEVTKQSGMKYTKEEGEAAFYGPKLDFMVRDSIGREWQLGTIQIDYNLPERFELEYIGEDSAVHRPVMIHRAPFGSLERFIGILTEHFAGAFPVWLSPVQALVLPISDKHAEYARSVVEKLRESEIRVEIDERNESIGKRVRTAEMNKVPFILAVGDREIEGKAVTVRTRGQEKQEAMEVNAFIVHARKVIESKRI